MDRCRMKCSMGCRPKILCRKMSTGLMGGMGMGSVHRCRSDGGNGNGFGSQRLLQSLWIASVTMFVADNEQADLQKGDRDLIKTVGCVKAGLLERTGTSGIGAIGAVAIRWVSLRLFLANFSSVLCLALVFAYFKHNDL
ncbi:hypothetical protein L6452_10642 [Arctium lappa]|uniref:Uncharacterized protein n=1 Tax=Arctium lappa TaxID=4217 RepID=A0ACB9DNC7_ARCLA|nr:hypothetical protein L6452_10642 [Arctium lappa]